MRRIHAFEIEDQPWCPEPLRKGMTEFLATVARLSKLWAPTVGVLQELLNKSAEKNIVVLGAGSGGGILDVAKHLPQDVRITLTDLYPHQKFQCDDTRIHYLSRSVDATVVPADLKGIRVIYAALHHFRPEQAKRVLASAVENKQPIAIFECTERSAKGILATLFSPVAVLLITPFIRPFKLARIFFTYAVPVLPLAVLWDGLVSALRTYDVNEMEELVAGFPTYQWTIRVIRGPRGETIPTLTGAPKPGV